jgi:radical SAM superfamily enzyme YgiQ (UPF0313 family)
MVKKKKILLIEPPFYRLHNNSYSSTCFPLAQAYLAGSILQHTNWSVKTFNADFIPSGKRIIVSYLADKGYNSYLKNLNDLSKPVWQKVRRTIEEFNPDIIGISSVSSNYVSACNVALIAKKYNKNIKIVLGGPYPTMAGKSILENPLIDISVVGEGEITIAELLNCLENGDDLKGISGIVYRMGQEIIENNKRNFIGDLDTLPFPHVIAKNVLIDYELYPMNAFKHIMTSRGCPFDCLFCASKELWTKKVRFRSADNVRSEIESLMSMGISRFNFIDDTFGYNKKFTNELCHQLKTFCNGIKWTCLTRVDLINESVLELMKDAGCRIIQIGIESGNNDLLAQMKKDITVEETLDACNLIKKHNIELQTFFLVGFPHETEETLKDTVRMMKKCKSDKIMYSIFTPYPYTPLFEFCENNGLIDKSHDPTIFNHTSPKNCFSLYIPHERFRKLAGKIERMVDRQNSIKRIVSVFSHKGLYKLQDTLGIKLIGIRRRLNA